MNLPSSTEPLFQHIFAHCPDALLLTDDDGDIVHANHAAEDLFQLPSFLLLQCNVRQLVGKPAERRERWEDFLRDGQQRQHMRLRDGQSVEYHAKAHILNGHHLIVWRKNGAPMTHEHASSQQWAAIAHELRSPLSAMMSAIEVLKKTRAETTSSRALETLERQTRHLGKLLDALMENSRNELGKVRLEKKEVELLPLLEHAVEIVMPHLEEKRQKLRRVIPAECVVHADAPKFTQVFVNLLHNASKFTPHQGTIEVSAEVVHGEVRICVRDNGRGIEKDHLETIFEPFSQAHPSTDASLGGLGLGLTLARHWVMAHGGELTAHSDGHGRGSEFRMRLPPAESADFFQHALSILVVDDEHDGRELLKELLETQGHRVRAARNGHEALELTIQQHPDVVILDFHLPDVPGSDVAYQIRRLELQHGRSPSFIVGLSGEAAIHSQQEIIHAGCDVFALKPFDFDTLKSLLERAKATHSSQEMTAADNNTL